jgi:hypothetical protein
VAQEELDAPILDLDAGEALRAPVMSCDAQRVAPPAKVGMTRERCGGFALESSLRGGCEYRSVPGLAWDARGAFILGRGQSRHSFRPSRETS